MTANVASPQTSVPATRGSRRTCRLCNGQHVHGPLGQCGRLGRNDGGGNVPRRKELSTVRRRRNKCGRQSRGVGVQTDLARQSGRAQPDAATKEPGPQHVASADQTRADSRGLRREECGDLFERAALKMKQDDRQTIFVRNRSSSSSSTSLIASQEASRVTAAGSFPPLDARGSCARFGP